MKQSAAKTLGVAALGAAFAAAAAGSATAAPAVPDAPSALNTMTSTVPVGTATALLPPGAAEGLAAGQEGLGRGLSHLPVNLPLNERGGVLVGGLPVGLPVVGG
ncbi:ATP-binding protein [Streptomyces spiramyceticus]|uniref:ATP-binding protein n=1 Tax=Streptomyces spiramyceticus TaxID=299717 RepID=UPI00237C0E3D|nr:ATP-binding protein [Streptomyces spiramyceticus]